MRTDNGRQNKKCYEMWIIVCFSIRAFIYEVGLSKGQNQCRAHFDLEYLVNGDRYGNIFLFQLNVKSYIPFRLEYLYSNKVSVIVMYIPTAHVSQMVTDSESITIAIEYEVIFLVDAFTVDLNLF